jgi:hypothetical protein
MLCEGLIVISTPIFLVPLYSLPALPERLGQAEPR